MPQAQPVIYQPMKYRLIYFALSLIVLVPGVYALITFGLKPSVDFTGGSTITWAVDTGEAEGLEQLFTSREIEVKKIERKDSEWTITTGSLERATYESVLNEATQRYQIKEREFVAVGPSLGRELVKKTLYAIALATGFILLYVTYRFRDIKFGATAIVAMLHDTLVLLGTFSILGAFAGAEVDTLFVTAVLTVLSFSVHDTIVVYDRIRELGKHHRYLSLEETINRAVVETLGRSVNNSMTIIFMLLAMYLMGGETIKWFIFALLIGTISGTYSSTFTAAPLLVVWDRVCNKKGK